MDDSELDTLLATRAQPTNPRVEAAVAELVVAARVEVAAASEPRRTRRRWAGAGVVLGAVVLTAGGTLTAAQLNLPPFQTLEPGIQRIQQPIPVDYAIDTGKAVRCQAFLEYRNLTQRQMDTARTYVAQRDWSGFGQQAYDTAKRTAGTSAPDPVDRAFGDILDREFRKVAQDAVPIASSQIDATGPTISGYSMSCPTGQR